MAWNRWGNNQNTQIYETQNDGSQLLYKVNTRKFVSSIERYSIFVDVTTIAIQAACWRKMK